MSDKEIIPSIAADKLLTYPYSIELTNKISETANNISDASINEVAVISNYNNVKSSVESIVNNANGNNANGNNANGHKLHLGIKQALTQNIIKNVKSYATFDACNKTTYINYLNHFNDLSNNFTKARLSYDEGYAFSTDYGLMEIFKRKITDQLNNIVNDASNTEYLILNETKFNELIEQKPPNYRSILLKMINIEKMNNIEYSTTSAYTIYLIQTAMFLLDTLIKVMEKIKVSPLKESSLVLAKYLLLRFRIIYGTSGKNSCIRVTNLLSGITNDSFRNSFKVSDKDPTLTDKQKMYEECRAKFKGISTLVGWRCKSLVQSRINFNDVLDISCNLKPKSQLINKTLSPTIDQPTSSGGRKNFTKRIKSMKNKRNIKKRRRTKKKYNGGDEGEAMLYAFGAVGCGIGLMVSDAAAMGASGATAFNFGAALLCAGVLVVILLMRG